MLAARGVVTWAPVYCFITRVNVQVTLDRQGVRTASNHGIKSLQAIPELQRDVHCIKQGGQRLLANGQVAAPRGGGSSR